MLRIHDDTIYLTDNGRPLCGAHLGATARTTGRDLSGQPIEPVTPELVAYALARYGQHPACERCGRPASLIHHLIPTEG